MPAAATAHIETTVAEALDSGKFDMVVYSKPNCVQCGATYRAAERHGVRFAVIDIPEMTEVQLAEYERTLAEEGFRQAPVVVSRDRRWSGFVPDNVIAAARPE